MNDHPGDPYTQHQEVFLLLPWYVNSSLRQSELKSVESHLKVCLICKREVTALQRLALSVQTTDTLNSAAQASFSRLQHRLHQNEPEAARIKTPITNRRKISRRFSFNFFKLPQPVMAMMAVLVMMIVIPGYYFSTSMQNNSYRTLANSESTILSNRDIHVIFDKGVDSEQIKKALIDVNAEIVDGPSPEGLYLIRLAEPDDRIDTLTSLRNNAIIDFAEPAGATSYSLQSQGESSK